MGAFLLRRTALLVPVVIGITLAVFFLIRLIPGDPARVLLGIHATPGPDRGLRPAHARPRPVRWAPST